MSERREIKNLLEDIYSAAAKITTYTKDMSFDDFMQDDKTIDAVVRNFEIIGEVSNRIPDDFKTEHPEIEWRRIVGYRNRIIHEYFGVDYENVWRIKNENIPVLQEFIKQILDNLDD